MVISFIGAGNMGSSIASSLSNKYDLVIYEKDVYKVKELKQSIKAYYASSIEDALYSADVVVLAIKPQVLPSIYDVLRENSDGKKFISIAAGVPLDVLHDNIGSDELVRFMPNIAAKVGSSVTAVAPYKCASKEFTALCLDIASQFGSAFLLDEALFPAFIGISGSAIAFIFEFIHALSLGGTNQGISYNESVKIVTATLNSAVKLEEESYENPVSLMSKVCSAKGTTIEGMNELYEKGFDAAVISAVNKASLKSILLEQKAKE